MKLAIILICGLALRLTAGLNHSPQDSAEGVSSGPGATASSNPFGNSFRSAIATWPFDRVSIDSDSRLFSPPVSASFATPPTAQKPEEHQGHVSASSKQPGFMSDISMEDSKDSNAFRRRVVRSAFSFDVAGLPHLDSLTCSISDPCNGLVGGLLDTLSGSKFKYAFGGSCFVLMDKPVSWEASISACDTTTLSLNVDVYGQEPVFTDEDTYKEIMTKLSRQAADSGTTGKFWLRAKAVSGGEKLADYCWMTDAVNAGSQLTNDDITVNTIGTSQFCLAVDISDPLNNISGLSCANSCPLALCEFSCAPPATSATCTGAAPMSTTSSPTGSPPTCSATAGSCEFIASRTSTQAATTVSAKVQSTVSISSAVGPTTTVPMTTTAPDLHPSSTFSESDTVRTISESTAASSSTPPTTKKNQGPTIAATSTEKNTFTSTEGSTVVQRGSTSSMAQYTTSPDTSTVSTDDASSTMVSSSTFTSAADSSITSSTDSSGEAVTSSSGTTDINTTTNQSGTTTIMATTPVSSTEEMKTTAPSSSTLPALSTTANITTSGNSTTAITTEKASTSPVNITTSAVTTAANASADTTSADATSIVQSTTALEEDNSTDSSSSSVYQTTTTNGTTSGNVTSSNATTVPISVGSSTATEGRSTTAHTSDMVTTAADDGTFAETTSDLATSTQHLSTVTLDSETTVAVSDNETVSTTEDTEDSYASDLSSSTTTGAITVPNETTKTVSSTSISTTVGSLTETESASTTTFSESTTVDDTPATGANTSATTGQTGTTSTGLTGTTTTPSSSTESKSTSMGQTGVSDTVTSPAATETSFSNLSTSTFPVQTSTISSTSIATSGSNTSQLSSNSNPRTSTSRTQSSPKISSFQSSTTTSKTSTRITPSSTRQSTSISKGTSKPSASTTKQLPTSKPSTSRSTTRPSGTSALSKTASTLLKPTTSTTSKKQTSTTRSIITSRILYSSTNTADATGTKTSASSSSISDSELPTTASLTTSDSSITDYDSLLLNDTTADNDTTLANDNATPVTEPSTQPSQTPAKPSSASCCICILIFKICGKGVDKDSSECCKFDGDFDWDGLDWDGFDWEGVDWSKVDIGSLAGSGIKFPTGFTLPGGISIDGVIPSVNAGSSPGDQISSAPSEASLQSASTEPATPGTSASSNQAESSPMASVSSDITSSTNPASLSTAPSSSGSPTDPKSSAASDLSVATPASAMSAVATDISSRSSSSPSGSIAISSSTELLSATSPPSPANGQSTAPRTTSKPDTSSSRAAISSAKVLPPTSSEAISSQSNAAMSSIPPLNPSNALIRTSPNVLLTQSQMDAVSKPGQSMETSRASASSESTRSTLIPPSSADRGITTSTVQLSTTPTSLANVANPALPSSSTAQASEASTAHSQSSASASQQPSPSQSSAESTSMNARTVPEGALSPMTSREPAGTTAETLVTTALILASTMDTELVAPELLPIYSSNPPMVSGLALSLLSDLSSTSPTPFSSSAPMFSEKWPTFPSSSESLVSITGSGQYNAQDTSSKLYRQTTAATPGPTTGSSASLIVSTVTDLVSESSAGMGTSSFNSLTHFSQSTNSPDQTSSAAFISIRNSQQPSPYSSDVSSQSAVPNSASESSGIVLTASQTEVSLASSTEAHTVAHSAPAVVSTFASSITATEPLNLASTFISASALMTPSSTLIPSQTQSAQFKPQTSDDPRAGIYTDTFTNSQEAGSKSTTTSSAYNQSESTVPLSSSTGYTSTLQPSSEIQSYGVSQSSHQTSSDAAVAATSDRSRSTASAAASTLDPSTTPFPIASVVVVSSAIEASTSQNTETRTTANGFDGLGLASGNIDSGLSHSESADSMQSNSKTPGSPISSTETVEASSDGIGSPLPMSAAKDDGQTAQATSSTLSQSPTTQGEQTRASPAANGQPITSQTGDGSVSPVDVPSVSITESRNSTSSNPFKIETTVATTDQRSSTAANGQASTSNKLEPSSSSSTSAEQLDGSENSNRSTAFSGILQSAGGPASDPVGGFRSIQSTEATQVPIGIEQVATAATPVDSMAPSFQELIPGGGRTARTHDQTDSTVDSPTPTILIADGQRTITSPLNGDAPALPSEKPPSDLPIVEQKPKGPTNGIFASPPPTQSASAANSESDQGASSLVTDNDTRQPSENILTSGPRPSPTNINTSPEPAITSDTDTSAASSRSTDIASQSSPTGGSVSPAASTPSFGTHGSSPNSDSPDSTNQQSSEPQSSSPTLSSKLTSETSAPFTSSSSVVDPSVCDAADWEPFGPCSAKCGDSFQTRQRQRTASMDLGTVCPNQTSTCDTQKCNPMGDIAQIVSNVMMNIGCIWIMASLALSLAFFIGLRQFYYLHVIHANEDFSLLMAHLSLLLFAVRNDEKYSRDVCALAALALQYFFSVNFMLLCMEALHINVVLTDVAVGDQSFIGIKTSLGIAWGIPAIITGITGAVAHSRLISDYSCWINMRDESILATVIPVASIAWLAVILIEATGGGTTRRTTKEVMSCRIAQGGLFSVLGAQVASWFMSALAIYAQHVSLFAIVLALNATLGGFIYTSHVFSNKKARAIVVNLYKRISG